VDDSWFLKQIDWLRELDGQDWAALEKRATRHHFERGQLVFEPARDPRSVYLLERGRVRIYRLSSSGDEATLGYVMRGEVFGELAGFGPYARESFAVAKVDSEVWKVPVELFRELVSKRPSLVIDVTRLMGERMKRVESRVESLILRNVRSRLAGVLLELAEDLGQQSGEGWVLELHLSQGEIATLIGASRQSVNAALARFREDGWVRQDGARLILLEPQRLRAVAEAGSG
jgi:CRP/FNR family cyclic AMP-dependent transcriptional regulator